MTGETKSSKIFHLPDIKNDVFNNIYINKFRLERAAPLEMESYGDEIGQKLSESYDHKNIVIDTGCTGVVDKTQNYISSIQQHRHNDPIIPISVDFSKVGGLDNNIFINNLSQKIHSNIYPMPLGTPRDIDIRNLNIVPNTQKHKMCYANFSITNMYRISVMKWAAEQEYIDCRFIKRFPEWDDVWGKDISFSEKIGFADFVQELSQYKFAITPNGVGIDTERLWECVLLNVIPIAQRNYANEIFSKIWPMLLVEKYETNNLQKIMLDFENTHGEIVYDTDLLLSENLPFLLDRISFECKRV
jgi:hypothetical protein